MAQTKTTEEIINYENTKSDFSDFPKFEGKKARRQYEKLAFINNLNYTPNYDYPHLESLISDEELQAKKHSIYEAVLELEAAKQNPEHSKEELELFASYHEYRLKKIMLVEVSRDLVSNPSSIDIEKNRWSFAELNEAIYGEFDADTFVGMINSEKENLHSFIPESQIAFNIKTWLTNGLDRIKTDGKIEQEIIGNVEISRLHEYVTNRYKSILDVVPDTPDDVYYDTKSCVDIINLALQAGGLSQYGWKALENSDKFAPTTMASTTTIALPSNTRRNAMELKRLIIHEQEVHARRSQNAKESSLKPIILGTANYADIEEGFGIMLECMVSGDMKNSSIDRARDRYITAGLALGADGQPRDAREVYEILWRILAVRQSNDGVIDENAVKKSKNDAYSHIENAYRGTQFWMKGVIYTKLKVYYEGFIKNADYFKANIDNLEAAFEDALIGKYDHTDPEEKKLVKSLVQSKSKAV